MNVIYQCPNCFHDMRFHEQNGCLFSFLFFPLFILFPVGVGIGAHALNSSLNLGDWMFHAFPTTAWYGQGLWHIAVVAAISGTLMALLITKVFRVRVRHYYYCTNPQCGRTYVRLRGGKPA